MHNIRRFSIAVLALLLVISCNQRIKTPAPEEVGMSGDTLELAARRMQEYVEQGMYPGISVMVIKDGQVVQNERFGYADIEESVPLEDHTIFRIFSMTKPVTTAGLMVLYDEGKIQLDDKVSKYIPEIAETLVYTPNENGFTLEPQIEEITIRHLLTHTSGLTYGWDPDSFVDSIYRNTQAGSWAKPLNEMVKHLATLPLKYQPGTRWEYGLSIDVAGYLIEILSGMPLDEYFKTRIFDPLNMDDTDFRVPEKKHERLSTLYKKDGEGNLSVSQQMLGADFNDLFKQPALQFSGGGGLVSTIGDYRRFCEMLLGGGELDGNRILKESTVGLIMSDQMPEGVAYRDGISYGLGGDLEIESGAYSWAGAASTSFGIYPKDKMIILAFTQLMPSSYTYAGEYKKLVRNAVIH